MEIRNIAIIGTGFVSWAGGRDFLRFCVNAMLAQETEYQRSFYILIPEPKRSHRIKNTIRLIKQQLKDILRGQIPQYVRQDLLERQAILDTFANINGDIKIIFFRNTRQDLISVLTEIKADVVLPIISPFEKKFPFPWVGYIDDFQYKYLPQFFNSRQIKSRSNNVEKMLDQARAIIVNSKAVREDIDRFYPDNKATIFTLPFAPVPSDKWFEEPNEALFKKYNIPKKYFIISNQFWIHKSHITAFKALAVLNQRLHERISIVCTGNTDDHRFPYYFNELKSQIKEMGLEQQVIILGHIPKYDQIQIMKKSIAVIQPTLFEGGPGGGAVYDAVALGIPAIVSDITVNKEIEEETVCFFEANSPDDLAKKMELIVLKGKADARPKEYLLLQGQYRTRRLGDILMQAIDHVVAQKAKVDK